MAVKFCQLFTNKISNILKTVLSVIQPGTDCCLFSARAYSGQSLNVFSPVTDDEVLTLISKLPNKSSPRDILPTMLLKSCADAFAPLICRLANISFQSGE